ncbi:MAG: TlpA family protein disulfide reductase [Bacteroidetes bacterium]|nr:MAG: TlpA family protein disulfide reductase [Bacteroidota bacterium]
MKVLVLICSLILSLLSAMGQKELAPNYRAYVVRPDSNTVVFNMQVSKEKTGTYFYIINADEKIKVGPVSLTNDSVNFAMPVFESSFKTKRNADGSFQGIWNKGTTGEFQNWPFYAYPNQLYRFTKTQGSALYNISGKWDVTITRPNGTPRKALAEFEQSGDKLTGSFLTPSGDYRFLEGIVTGDSLKLSTFDGSHAYTFYAKIASAEKITGGLYLAGYSGKETWSAVKDNNVKEPQQEQPTKLKPGESKLNFTFNDLEGKPVSINDERFKNKVVVVQLMGSWCPNCMDETKFLSDFYNKYRSKGVEIVSLAYEYSTDIERSRKSLSKFQKLFNVQYPMLITGVTSTDEQKTEKTLPQLSSIQSFPTSIFLDRKGNVKEVHSVFYGPGTKQYFEEYKKIFTNIVEGLLKEKN